MFKFTDYIHEIYTIAKDQNAPLDVAYDKFRADVRDGLPRSYNTGDSIIDFDFTAAKREWDALTEEQQCVEYSRWHGLTANHAALRALDEAYPDREKMLRIVNALDD